MAKSNKLNPNVVFGGIIIILVLFFMSSNGNITNIFQSTTEAQVPFSPEEYALYNVYLTIFPSEICVGDTTTGSISSNINNGICTIFTNINDEGWNVYKNVVLDSTGDYSETSNPILATGYAKFRAICCDADMNCKISNDDDLNVNTCDSPSPSCSSSCSSHDGYYTTNEEQICYSYATSQCNSDVTIYTDVGIENCCCYDCETNGGDGNGGEPQYTCTDSDGGINTDVAGYCEDSFHQLGFADKCVNLDLSGVSTEVEEYYCNDNGICESTIVTCPTQSYCYGNSGGSCTV